MANTYYDSQLTSAEIEAALKAIDGVIVPANNGKVLAINNGKIEARSVQWGGGEPVLEPLSVTANGDYTPEAGVDGFDEVHVSVPNSYSASDEGKVVSNGALVAQTARASQITQNGTYDTTLNDEVTVNVSGGGSAVVQPLSVTQNGTYNPPSGVDGYAPVTVNVSGGSGSTKLLYGRAGTNLDTLVPLNTNDLKINLKFLATGTATQSILGDAWSADGIFLMFYNNMVRLHYGGKIITTGTLYRGPVEIEFDSSGIIVDGTEYAFTTPPPALSSENTITLWDVVGTSAFQSPGDFTLYSCKIWSGSTLIRDFEPAMHNDTPCLYEKVAGEYYYTTGNPAIYYEWN